MFETKYTKDEASKTILVDREFAAPLKKVWTAWSTSELLDKWWAPKPWVANTVSFDFRTGGQWLYYMSGPNGEKAYSLADYELVEPMRRFVGLDAFCDEHGKIDPSMPRMKWDVQFSEDGDTTKVHVTITFPTVEDLNKIVQMGFKEGFAMAHGNLDELLAE